MQNKNSKEREVLLKVEHLCQYFKMGPANELKAVDDVNFEIRKGEVFGLVGESGCGKTTTGRSIIRLYDITSGNIIFKGQRIGAGIRSYKDAIRNAKENYRRETAEIKAQMKADGSPDARLKGQKRLEAAEKELSRTIAEQNENIRAAKEDQKHCNQKYAEEQAKKVRQLYEPCLARVRDAFDKCTDQDHTGTAAQNLLRVVKGAAEEVEKGRRMIDISAAGEMIKAAGTENTDSAGKDDAYTRASNMRAQLEGQYREDLRLAKKDRIMNKMQMIFQDPIASLDPRMTVKDIIAEGLVIRGVRNQKYIDELVYRMLDLVGLVPEHAGRYPHEFSGGQRQRIGIARAIILNPDFIIADEPISALDVSIQAQVINLLNDLRNRLGLTIRFIAHDLSVVKYFSDTIAVMYYGKIVELASSDELFAHPLHPYTKSLLSSIPLPDPEFEKGRTRIVYNPIAEHDYSVDKPVMREIIPGHLIQCNNAEFEKYKAEIADVR
jgi:oligopeptide transport system ATP-binding protein